LRSVSRSRLGALILAMYGIMLVGAPAIAADFRLRDTSDPEVTRALASAIADISTLDKAPPLQIEQSRLQKLARAFGYLDALVVLAPAAGTDWPQAFDLTVTLGHLYKVGSIQIIGMPDDGPDPLAVDLQARLQKTVAQPARSDILSRLVDDVRWRIEQASYPLVRITRTELAIDRVTRTASATIIVSPGPRATFGAVTFKGVRGAEIGDLEALVPFKRGAPFDPVQLDVLRVALGQAPRIRSASVSLGDAVSPAGEIPVEVRLDQYQDPQLLTSNKTLGAAALAAGLLLLVAREVRRRFQNSAALGIAIDASLLVAFGLGVAVTAVRAWAFIQFG